jgi:hypothetical protein
METRRNVNLSVNDVKNLPSNFDKSEDTMATHYALNIYCFGSGRIICILNMILPNYLPFYTF